MKAEHPNTLGAGKITCSSL